MCGRERTRRHRYSYDTHWWSAGESSASIQLSCLSQRVECDVLSTSPPTLQFLSVHLHLHALQVSGASAVVIVNDKPGEGPLDMQPMAAEEDDNDGSGSNAGTIPSLSLGQEVGFKLLEVMRGTSRFSELRRLSGDPKEEAEGSEGGEENPDGDTLRIRDHEEEGEERTGIKESKDGRETGGEGDRDGNGQCSCGCLACESSLGAISSRGSNDRSDQEAPSDGLEDRESSGKGDLPPSFSALPNAQQWKASESTVRQQEPCGGSRSRGDGTRPEACRAVRGSRHVSLWATMFCERVEQGGEGGGEQQGEEETEEYAINLELSIPKSSNYPVGDQLWLLLCCCCCLCRCSCIDFCSCYCT